MRSKGFDLFCMLWNYRPCIFIILKTNFSSHWKLPNPFLFVLVFYWLKVKIKLSAFTIYNVLTQTGMAEKELHVVFATTLAWVYSGHKVVFHPKGL